MTGTPRWVLAQSWPIKAALLVAAAPRLWFALGDHSVFWPDEIYQTIEPAHRLAFGYGFLPWEFRDGARSWSFPGLLALPLKLVSLLHVKSGLALVVTARLVMVALALWGTAVGIEYARRLGGKAAAVIAAFALALFPPLLVYSHRTLQEAASAPLVMVVPLLLLTRTPRAARLAGLAVGLATLLRFQCAILAGTFLVALVFQRRFRDVRDYAGAGALVGLAGGLLDWVTWGRPFHSIITYIEFNLVRSGASTFGVSPRSYFLTTLWSSAGPLVVLVALGLAVACLGMARASAAAVVLFVALHSAIPHKEFRFVLPVLPLMLSAGAIGLADLLGRLKAPAWGASAVAALVALGFVRSAYGAGYGDFGQYTGSPRARNSVWNTDEEPNLLLADVGRAPDLCGVLMLGVRAAFTGGYSYLHRDVPLLYRFHGCNEAKSANYVVAARDDGNVPPEFQLVKSRGRYGLFRRDGECAPPPADFTAMLDGADDMGLGRAPILQPDLQELRISAGSSSAAFVRGFGNGEHLDCRHVRWATGTSAQIAFPLEPTRAPYALSFTAQPYGRTLPQSMHVALNGHELLYVGLAAGWRGYQAFVPPELLRHGRNVLDLSFARAVRAEGEDTRELAALFDQIVLAPADTSVRIDAGTEEGRAFLGRGFGGDEHGTDRTFVWSDGPTSEMTLSLQDASSPMVLQVLARAYPLVAPLHVAVSVNEQAAGTLTLGPEFTRASLLVPAGQLHPGVNALGFAYSATAKPSEREAGSADTRDLSMMLDTVLVAPLRAGAKLDFGTPAAHPYQEQGFSQDESFEQRTFVWSDGPTSRLWFVGGPDASGCTLRIETAAFAAAPPLEVAVALNGRRVGAFAPTVAWSRYAVPLGEPGVLDGVNRIELAYSRAVSPSDVTPGSHDRRRLALRLDRAEITCGDYIEDGAQP